MTDTTNLHAIGALLSLSDWDKRADGRVIGPYGVEITAPRPGELMISFPDPHSRSTAYVTFSGEWSFGMVADMATHLVMMARLVSTVRGTEGE